MIPHGLPAAKVSGISACIWWKLLKWYPEIKEHLTRTWTLYLTLLAAKLIPVITAFTSVANLITLVQIACQRLPQLLVLRSFPTWSLVLKPVHYTSSIYHNRNKHREELCVPNQNTSLKLKIPRLGHLGLMHLLRELLQLLGLAAVYVLVLYFMNPFFEAYGRNMRQGRAFFTWVQSGTRKSSFMRSWKRF